MTVIGISLGQFKSSSGLTTLHGSFQAFFIQLARSLGYVVVGVNEFFTSKKCLTCEQFVYQVNIRRLFWKSCKSFIHRDILAAHNMCNIVKSHLLIQERPDYLQPIDEDGNMPWKKNDSAAPTHNPSATSSPLPKKAQKIKAPLAQNPSSSNRSSKKTQKSKVQPTQDSSPALSRPFKRSNIDDEPQPNSAPSRPSKKAKPVPNGSSRDLAPR
ncbi:hypothetical protein EC991_004145 [Linnemannia zychae]|nr:hypothetical protein EC991_004145 [Linnemannia zychae]